MNRNNALKVIKFRDILYCRAEGNYTRIHLNEEVLFEARNLQYFESRLPAGEFFRIHKSCLVNISAINCLDGNILLLKKGHQLLVARRRKRALLKLLSDNSLLIR